MHIRKTLLAALAVAIAIAFSPWAELQAATFGPGSQPGIDSLIHSVKLKKKSARKGKKRGKHKRGKKAGSKAGRCGAYMYFSKKSRKCMDARNKK
ncbi:MAG TPA: hypothetical protein VH519_05885 [Hyphomicrobiaceae bacterium]|jgi:hypothetical protein